MEILALNSYFNIFNRSELSDIEKLKLVSIKLFKKRVLSSLVRQREITIEPYLTLKKGCSQNTSKFEVSLLKQVLKNSSPSLFKTTLLNRFGIKTNLLTISDFEDPEELKKCEFGIINHLLQNFRGNERVMFLLDSISSEESKKDVSSMLNTYAFLKVFKRVGIRDNFVNGVDIQNKKASINERLISLTENLNTIKIELVENSQNTDFEILTWNFERMTLEDFESLYLSEIPELCKLMTFKS